MRLQQSALEELGEVSAECGRAARDDNRDRLNATIRLISSAPSAADARGAVRAAAVHAGDNSSMAAQGEPSVHRAERAARARAAERAQTAGLLEHAARRIHAGCGGGIASDGARETAWSNHARPAPPSLARPVLGPPMHAERQPADDPQRQHDTRRHTGAVARTLTRARQIVAPLNT